LKFSDQYYSKECLFFCNETLFCITTLGALDPDLCIRRVNRNWATQALESQLAEWNSKTGIDSIHGH